MNPVRLRLHRKATRLVSSLSSRPFGTQAAHAEEPRAQKLTQELETPFVAEKNRYDRPCIRI